jgi:hypothetical protein
MGAGEAQVKSRQSRAVPMQGGQRGMALRSPSFGLSIYHLRD